jgi:Uma2 family endonuclease
MFQLREEHPSRHGEAMNPDEFEQLVERVPDSCYEYMHGRAYAMSGGTANHSRLTGKMFRLLEEQLTSGPCHAFFDMYVVLAEDSRVLPDVVVTCDMSDYRGNATLIRSPHLIVEVLSTSTERIDRNEKFHAYTQIPSVEEYVLVHQYRSQVEVYRRVDDWVLHMYGLRMCQTPIVAPFFCEKSINMGNCITSSARFYATYAAQSFLIR